MKELIKNYIKNDLVPFSFSIGWNTNNNKKELIMPINWASCNKDNYKEHINKKVIESKKEGIINIKNCLGLKMGTITKDNFKIIGLDIDNKPDDKEKNIFNGYIKWLDVLKEQNKNNNYVRFKFYLQSSSVQALPKQNMYYTYNQPTVIK